MSTVMNATNARERTVRSAALLFRQYGIGQTGLRDIVEHAGAPRGSLQHYFPGGKQELVTEAMAWIAERAARPLLTVLLEDPPPPARQVVADLIDRFRELLTMTEFRAGCPIAAAVVDASASSDAVTEAAGEAFTTWLTPLEQALRRGGLSRDRARRVALVVVGGVEGALLISRARRDFAALDALAAELDLLLSVPERTRGRRGRRTA
jgi:AcrR family transcriptional regulator